MPSNNKYITYSEAASLMSDVNQLTFYGTSGTALYSPLDTYDTLVNIKDPTGNSAVKSVTSAITRSQYDSSYFYDIQATLYSNIINKKTTGNAWYPQAIAGKQYANMTNGNCLPIYYCSGVTINPYQGAFKANDLVLISGNTEVSVADWIRSLEPSTVSIPVGSITGVFASQGNSFYMYGITITLSSGYDSVSWTFPDSWGGQEIERTASPSKSTLTVGDDYQAHLEISGEVDDAVLGRNSVTGMVVYIYGFNSYGVDILSYGGGADVIVSASGIPYDTNCTIDFNM